MLLSVERDQTVRNTYDYFWMGV